MALSRRAQLAALGSKQLVCLATADRAHGPIILQIIAKSPNSLILPAFFPVVSRLVTEPGNRGRVRHGSQPLAWREIQFREMRLPRVAPGSMGNTTKSFALARHALLTADRLQDLVRASCPGASSFPRVLLAHSAPSVRRILRDAS